MASDGVMTRREWLQTTAAGAMAAAAATRSEAASARRWGVQIYTVREQLKTQAAAAFKAIADIGYKEVELLPDGVAEAAKLAKASGLTPVSLHINAPLVTGDATAWIEAAKAMGMNPPAASPSLDAVIADAKAAGIKYLVVSYLMPNERSRPGFYDSFVPAMNKAGATIKKAGLQLCYHNHAFEFEKGSGGGQVLDQLLAGFDPALVKLELDVFWVSVAGFDPVALLNKNKGRVALVHLKDKAADAPVATSEAKVPPTAFKEVGSGSLDFKAILGAAEAAGVEHYFVEQDHTPGDPIASLKKSFTYLQQLT